jgi:putative ABC transport system permease protein
MRATLRSLLKAREFTFIAVAIVGIGIGATTAVFSVVDAALLRPLPFRNADRLFLVAGSNAKRAIVDGPFSYPELTELRARAQLVDGLAGIAPERFNVTGSGAAEQLAGARVSASFFDVIALDVAAGRKFVAADDGAGSPRVVILGRRYWLRRFNLGADAIGAGLTLNGAPHTVVGALGIDLPPPFDNVDVWSPHVDELSGFSPALINAGFGYLSAVARVPPSVEVSRAQAEIDAIAHGYARAHPTNTDADPDATLRLTPIRARTAGSSRSPLLMLMGAVGVVLLIACANVSNLLLVRATARSHEAAVRAALGASRWDLARWQGGESLMLAAAGGAAGMLLAFWGVDFASTVLRDVPRGSEVAVNLRVLLFSCAVTAAAGLLFGLVPASLVTRQRAADALRIGARGAVGAHAGPRRLLVVAEIALSLVLLVGAALLLRSFVRLTHVPVGFDPQRLLTFRVALPTSSYPDPPAMRTFMARAVPRLERMPGVSAVAASMALPPAITTMAPYLASGQPNVGIGERPVGQWSAITPGYFATLGIPLVAGRPITDRDTEAAPLVVVISDGLAKRAWPNESPLGKKLLVGRFPGFADVIGVVADVKNNGLAREPIVAMYTPYPQRPWPAMEFAIRAAGEPMALVNAVRAAMRDVDADLPITRVESMDAALAESIATERLIASLLGGFAVVALLLAAAGVYGVIAYTVAQRTTEIGVRVALGADPRAVLRLVAREGFVVTAAGMVAGTLAAAAAGQALRTLLFDVSPADPLAYAAVLALFAAVACAAVAIPARRALRVDPLVALRAE